MEEHTGEVDEDGWWSEVDRKMLEAAAFRSATPGKIEVQKMAPWIPQLADQPLFLTQKFTKVK